MDSNKDKLAWVERAIAFIGVESSIRIGLSGISSYKDNDEKFVMLRKKVLDILYNELL